MKERAHSIQIDDLMTRNPTTTTPDSTLESAARRMWTENRAFLPVVDSAGHVVGVLTDRDVSMCAYTQGRRLAELQVSTAMAKNVICARSGDHPSVVEELMLANRIHRIPIIDEEGVLAGVVSLPKLSAANRPQPEREAAPGPLTPVPMPRYPPSSKRSDELRKGT